MITFKASDTQVQLLMANAINASKPVGLGILQATDTVFAPDDFDLGDYVSLDYVQGRMVKLQIERLDDDRWRLIAHAEPSPQWQSWADKYPTYGLLLKSAGITESNSSASS